jgi:uncharacterized membrane protein
VVPFLLPPALIASGLVAGVLLWSAVCGVPLLRRLPADGYVRTHQFWANRFEPFQPICVLLTAGLDAVLLAVSPGPAAAVFGVGAAGALAVIAVSATRNVPVKKWVLTLRPDALPEDWDRRDPRREWGRWNLVRTVLACLVLVANATGTGLLL